MSGDILEKLVILAPSKVEIKKCQWKEHKRTQFGTYWKTLCDHLFMIDGDLYLSSYTYCPNCGKEIEEI